jgi:hypothetical protein
LSEGVGVLIERDLARALEFFSASFFLGGLDRATDGNNRDEC